MAADVIVVPGIDSLPVVVALRENEMLMATVRTAHLLGVSVLVGSVVAFDLRVLGLARSVPVAALARLLLPLAVAALVLVLPSGVAMFAAHAGDLLSDRLFTLKMALIFAGGVNAVVFHTGPYRRVASWPDAGPAPWSARLVALLSLLGWVAVIACASQLRPGLA